MTEKVKLSIEGPAWIVVPISEDIPTRWLFNDIVDHVQDHDVATEEELLFINSIMEEFFDYISNNEEASSTLLPEPVESNREEFREFHKKILSLMEGALDD
jgi:hypothetical protein